MQCVSQITALESVLRKELRTLVDITIGGYSSTDKSGFLLQKIEAVQ
jgi:hypothetical protein